MLGLKDNACRKLKVLAFDDQNSKDTARKKAIEVAQDSRVIAVIGHYFSSTSANKEMQSLIRSPNRVRLFQVRSNAYR